MHLAGKADALNARHESGMAARQLIETACDGKPPFLRIVLRPERPRLHRMQGQFEARQHVLARIDKNEFDRGCSDVDSDIHVACPS